MRRGWSGEAALLDGKHAAQLIKQQLITRVRALQEKGVTPGLGTILVGEDPGSIAYVKGKHRDCAEIGIRSLRIDLPSSACQNEVEEAIDTFNNDKTCTGYIVQLPLPERIDTYHILERMDPRKDADGLHPMNLGRLVTRVYEPIHTPLPCTPRACLELMKYYSLDCCEKHMVVVGRGITIGRLLGLLASRKDINATVTNCHTGTRHLKDYTRQADILVSAAGVAGIITPDMVKPGAIVLDVGVSRFVDPSTGRSRLEGDVCDGVDKVAGWLSPNPQGIGPMTRALLLVNIVEAAERAVGIKPCALFGAF